VALGFLVLATFLLVLACSADRNNATIRLVGMVHRTGFGCWVVDAAGDYYELLDLPTAFKTDSLVVTIRGRLRPDLASTCMVGPIVQVQSVEEVVP
jgi:hypothetical protein